MHTINSTATFVVSWKRENKHDNYWQMFYHYPMIFRFFVFSRLHHRFCCMHSYTLILRTIKLQSVVRLSVLLNCSTLCRPQVSGLTVFTTTIYEYAWSGVTKKIIPSGLDHLSWSKMQISRLSKDVCLRISSSHNFMCSFPCLFI